MEIARRTGHTTAARQTVDALLALGICALTSLRPGVVAGQVAQSPLFAPTLACHATCSERCGRGTAALASFSASVLADDSLFVQSGFVPATWEGYVTAYDAKAYLEFLAGRSGEPAPIWTANFPAPAERNIVTSSAQSTPVAFEWCNLGADQRALLDPNVRECTRVSRCAAADRRLAAWRCRA